MLDWSLKCDWCLMKIKSNERIHYGKTWQQLSFASSIWILSVISISRNLYWINQTQACLSSRLLSFSWYPYLTPPKNRPLRHTLSRNFYSSLTFLSSRDDFSSYLLRSGWCCRALYKFLSYFLTVRSNEAIDEFYDSVSKQFETMRYIVDQMDILTGLYISIDTDD